MGKLGLRLRNSQNKKEYINGIPVAVAVRGESTFRLIDFRKPAARQRARKP
jgi:hypothetical protein